MEFTHTLSRRPLSMLAWLLPLLMMFILVWVVALPFTGVELLFKTHSAALILLWCAALCISFANAAYQDGETSPPYGKYLNKFLAWAWLGLLVVVGVAWWAMWLRILQHGWSEDRVWGMFVALMATLYVAGYAASALRSTGWLASIGKTNMWSAVVMCLSLLALLSPIADARRIAVNSQMQRLTSQTVTSDKFDFDYLRWQAGKYGQDALRRLGAGIVHPDRDMLASKAKQVLAQKQRYQAAEGIKALTAEEMRQRIRTLPANTILSDALLQSMQAESGDNQLQRCFNTRSQCLVWLVDLNADSAPDAVVLSKNEWGDTGNMRVLQNQQGKYYVVGSLSWPGETSYDNLIQQLERGDFKAARSDWNEIELSGQRLQVMRDHR